MNMFNFYKKKFNIGDNVYIAISKKIKEEEYSTEIISGKVISCGPEKVCISIKEDILWAEHKIVFHSRCALKDHYDFPHVDWD